MTIPLLLRCSRRTLTRFPSWTRYCSSSSNAIATTDLSQVPLERIRNFSIIAHVDHGKSTFADRILEEVGAIDKDQQNKQILDKLQVERERGITVKAQTASIIYNHKGTTSCRKRDVLIS